MPQHPVHMLNQTCFVSDEAKCRDAGDCECNVRQSSERGRIKANLWNCSAAYCTTEGNDAGYRTYTQQHLLDPPFSFFLSLHLFLPSSLAPFLLYLATDVTRNRQLPDRFVTKTGHMARKYCPTLNTFECRQKAYLWVLMHYRTFLNTGYYKSTYRSFATRGSQLKICDFFFR